MMRTPLETRFWAKVAKSESCWSWMAGKDRLGYGHFKVDGMQAKAHRVSYEMHVGPIPEGLYLDHLCHNRACVRPDHLRLVTTKQNAENRAGAQANSSTGVRGVYRVWRSNTWKAVFQHNGKLVYVGSFTTKEAAAEAVRAKRNEVFTHSDMDRVSPTENRPSRRATTPTRDQTPSSTPEATL